jgi:hypothetical protein
MEVIILCRTESVNFIHDVNVLRQTLKGVYSSSADLQALNSEIDKLPKNCRLQVLPVCWRHLLDFPKKGVRQNRKEHDLGDAFSNEEEYPSLEDITVEGVPFVRSLITDLGKEPRRKAFWEASIHYLYFHSLGHSPLPKWIPRAH